MKESIKTVIKEISDGKIDVKESSILLQYIAEEYGFQTTTNYAKTNKLSYNGVKNHRPFVLIDGLKLHANGLEHNLLPF